MTENLIESIKKISCAAEENMDRVNIVYGQVICESPLEIITGQKMMLDEKRLVLTESTRKVEKEVLVNWNTTNDGSHIHSISGLKKIIVDNSLKNRDKVIMLKMQGGQKYIVLSKVVE